MPLAASRTHALISDPARPTSTLMFAPAPRCFTWKSFHVKAPGLIASAAAYDTTRCSIAFSAVRLIGDVLVGKFSHAFGVYATGSYLSRCIVWIVTEAVSSHEQAANAIAHARTSTPRHVSAHCTVSPRARFSFSEPASTVP